MRRLARRFVGFIVTAVVLMAIVNHVLRHHVHPAGNMTHAAAHPAVNVISRQIGAPKGPAAVRDTADADDTSDMRDDSDKSDSSDASDDSDSASDKAAASAHKRSGESRTVTIGRQFRPARDSASPVKVNVSYGVGTMTIRPADAPWLYDVRVAYDPAIMTPSVAFDTTARSLSVNSKSINMAPSHHNEGDGELQVALARHVPLDVRVEFGAGEGTMQFGGLSVRSLSVSAGASETSVGFDTPNGTDLDHLTLEVGAAGFKATGLGNARVHDVTVHAGAGDVDLDFGGHWTGDVTLEVTAALGAVHIHVPHGVVVDHTNKTFIGSFDDNTGGVSGAGGPQTPGGPMYHLHFSGTTALGSVELDHQTGT